MGIGFCGKLYSTCRVSFSSCLDVSRIKGLWTDAIVGWVITALLWLCVGVNEPALGVVAPCGSHDPGDLSVIPGGGFSGHSVWLQLVSRWEWLWCHLIGAQGHTVTCRFGIVYNRRAVAESYSLDTAPATG